MSEPTIDEMLEWLSKAKHPLISIQQNAEIAETIRAILEQHRDGRASLYDVRSSELAAVRAFMERVEKRAESVYCKDEDDNWPSAHLEAFKKELAAMEKETE